MHTLLQHSTLLCTVLGRWLFNADDPENDEGFGAKFAPHAKYVEAEVDDDEDEDDDGDGE